MKQIKWISENVTADEDSQLLPIYSLTYVTHVMWYMEDPFLDVYKKREIEKNLLYLRAKKVYKVWSNRWLNSCDTFLKLPKGLRLQSSYIMLLLYTNIGYIHRASVLHWDLGKSVKNSSQTFRSVWVVCKKRFRQYELIVSIWIPKVIAWNNKNIAKEEI